MATLKKLGNAYLTPARALPKAEAHAAWVNNMAAARLLTWGSRSVPGISSPHDHAEEGGEVLLNRPVVSLMLGPQIGGTGSVPKIGISMLPGSGSPAADFTVTPKCLLSAPIFLPGGVKALTGRVRVRHNSTDTILLLLTIRPLAAVNYKAKQGAGVTTTATFTPANGTEAYHGLAVSFADLTPLGDPATDRECELVVHMQYNITATKEHRLCAIYLRSTSSTAAGRQPRRTDTPLPALTTGEILTGSVLSGSLTRKLRRRLNAEMSGLLGRAPGVDADNESPDRVRPWTQPVEGAHLHRGVLVPDPINGAFFCDGAVIREQLVMQSYPRLLGENDPATAFNSNTYQGPLLHPNGALDSQWYKAQFRVSIPAGLGAFFVRFAILGSVIRHSTLKIHAGVLTLDGTSITRRVTTRLHTSESSADGGGLLVCQVDPEPNDAYEPTESRRRAGVSLWGLDSSVTDFSSGTGVNPPGIADNAWQVSELVKIEISHPATRASDTAHTTGDYRLVLRWELKDDDTASTYDTGARLNWVHALTERGW